MLIWSLPLSLEKELQIMSWHKIEAAAHKDNIVYEEFILRMLSEQHLLSNSYSQGPR